MKITIPTIAAAALALATSSARAQDSAQPESASYFQQHVAAPSNAFELTLGTGYTQGFGTIQAGVGMPSVVTPGFAVDLGAGYRLDPKWSVAVTGQYQEFKAERSDSARGMTAGLAASYHIAPYLRSDPFLQLGTGYRMLWEEPSNHETVLTHGFELAKLQAGLDLRVSEDVAVAPIVGVDVNTFLWQNRASDVKIGDPRLSAFVFAGAQGRFDLGGARKTERAAEFAAAR